MVGEESPNWKGGISGENKINRSRKEYKDWKLSVFKRDGFKCVQCGVGQGKLCECCGNRVLLHAHHIIPFSSNEALRYEVSNGMSLCAKCHRQEHFGKPGELLESPESPQHHNVAGNGERDGLKS